MTVLQGLHPTLPLAADPKTSPLDQLLCGVTSLPILWPSRKLLPWQVQISNLVEFDFGRALLLSHMRGRYEDLHEMSQCRCSSTSWCDQMRCELTVDVQSSLEVFSGWRIYISKNMCLHLEENSWAERWMRNSKISIAVMGILISSRMRISASKQWPRRPHAPLPGFHFDFFIILILIGQTYFLYIKSIGHYFYGNFWFGLC